MFGLLSFSYHAWCHATKRSVDFHWRQTCKIAFSCLRYVRIPLTPNEPPTEETFDAFLDVFKVIIMWCSGDVFACKLYVQRWLGFVSWCLHLSFLWINLLAHVKSLNWFLTLRLQWYLFAWKKSLAKCFPFLPTASTKVFGRKMYLAHSCPAVHISQWSEQIHSRNGYGLPDFSS